MKSISILISAKLLYTLTLKCHLYTVCDLVYSAVLYDLPVSKYSSSELLLRCAGMRFYVDVVCDWTPEKITPALIKLMEISKSFLEHMNCNLNNVFLKTQFVKSRHIIRSVWHCMACTLVVNNRRIKRFIFSCVLIRIILSAILLD